MYINGEDLEFSIINKKNESVTCNILSLITKNKNETYILFTDGEKEVDGNIIFKYGILTKENDDFILNSGVTDKELEYIKEKFYDDIVEFAKTLEE